MKKKIMLSVVIPCYNEEKNIPLIVSRFSKILPAKTNVELILVENGSKDGSLGIMRRLAKKHSFIKIVQVKKNIGYGNGIWQGLKRAGGEYLCWTHADMQTDLADTIKAYRIIEKQREPSRCFVKGNRKKRPFFDTFFAFGMSIFESLLLRTMLYDINAQPNLFHKSFLKKTGEPPKDFSFDLYFYYIAKKKGYEIIKFPVLFPERLHGVSNWNTSLASKWKFIKRTLKFSIELRKRIKNT